MTLFFKSFLNNVAKSIKNNWLLILFCSLFLIGSNTLTTLSNEVYFDAAISNYLDKYNVPPGNTYIHANFRGDGSADYIKRANQFHEDNKSPASALFSSYFTEGIKQKYTFSYKNFSFEETILALPYRQDTGRKYIETIRLRRHDVESANYIKPGSNFHIYISSVLADQILSKFPIFSSYDDIIKAEIDFSVFLHGRIQTGNICNIFYIEPQNPYSEAIYQYLDDFVILSNITEIINSGNFSVNYDFIPTHNRLKNFIKGPQLQFMNEYEVEIFDYLSPHTANSELMDLKDAFDRSPDYVFLKVLIGVTFTLPLFVWTFIDIYKLKNSLLGEKRIKQGFLFITLAFTQYLIFYLIKFLSTNDLVFFILRNTLYGTMINLIILMIALYWLSMRKSSIRELIYEIEI